MRQSPLFFLILLLFLTACGQAKPAASYLPPEEPLQDAFVAQEEDEAAQTKLLWIADVNGRTIALRDGMEPGTWDLCLEGDAPVLLTTLRESDGSIITTQPFTDILGYSGFSLRQSRNEGGDGGVMYYALEDTSIRLIAHSFGFSEVDDYPVDLDGDDIMELVTVNTYGADGCREVRVFRRQGDSVEIGRLTNEPELPDRGNWGIHSTAQGFDLERRTFQIQYDLKDTEKLGLVETVGLEWFTFEALDEESIWS